MPLREPTPRIEPRGAPRPTRRTRRTAKTRRPRRMGLLRRPGHADVARTAGSSRSGHLRIHDCSPRPSSSIVGLGKPAFGSCASCCRRRRHSWFALAATCRRGHTPTVTRTRAHALAVLALITLLRCVAVIFGHGPEVSALCAARTARSTSSALPLGMSAHGSPVYGLSLSKN